VETAVLDLGTRPVSTGSRVFAALNGALDAGVKIPHSAHILPSKERLRGEHVAAFGKMLSQKTDAYQKRFSAYLKQDLKPEDLPAHFDEVREKISHSFEKAT